MACAKSASSAFEPSVAYRAEEALDALAHLERRFFLELALAGAQRDTRPVASRSAGLRNDQAAHGCHCAQQHPDARAGRDEIRSGAISARAPGLSPRPSSSSSNSTLPNHKGTL